MIENTKYLTTTERMSAALTFGMSMEEVDEWMLREDITAVLGLLDRLMTATPAPAELRAIERLNRLTTCAHGGETVTRTCHGYLGDGPAGTTETLCVDCGAEVAS